MKNPFERHLRRRSLRLHGVQRVRSLVAFVVLCVAGSGVALATETPLAASQLVERQQVGQAPLLLDVRRADEYRDGHIAGALNIPVEQLGSRAGVLGVPSDREIVVYCVSGRRAARAQETLQSLGYNHVRLLDGSLNAWRQQQLPLVREGSADPAPSH